MDTSKDILNNQELLSEIWWGDSEEWKTVKDVMLSHGRWSVVRQRVFEGHVSPDTKGLPRYLSIVSEDPATEYQDGMERHFSARWAKKVTRVVEDYV